MNELEKIRKNKIEKLIKKFKDDKMETKIEVDDNKFNELIIEQSKKISVIADFWSIRCSPCLMLGPVLEKLADEYKGRFVLAKVNVEEAPIASQKYAVMSIPSVKLFKNGKIVDEFVGAMPEPMVRNWIEKNLDKEK